jgi:hypothetical protein
MRTSVAPDRLLLLWLNKQISCPVTHVQAARHSLIFLILLLLSDHQQPLAHILSHTATPTTINNVNTSSHRKTLLLLLLNYYFKSIL